MGIPKFFRWLSERYPLVNQPLNQQRSAVEYDNFFLDMNGVIHTCCHPFAESSRNVMTLDDMVLNIFRYLDKIFRLVLPRRLLYMAVDGVAPRAKMNQQRARRFRAAKEAKEAAENLRKAGAVVEETNLFDSNCITPGTKFMAELSEHIKFYVRKRQSEDVCWANVRVIFSGQEVPGEGEHKILDYLRHMKQQPDWDPLQTHCVYGLDADLICLGLLVHEPHFSVLREEVLSKEARRARKDELQFHLLHLSLLRDYLNLEYSTIKLPFKFDLERVIDDLVFLICFVGNDFLPGLPGVDIIDGALNKLVTLYRKLLPTMGYITDKERIAYPKLARVFKCMADLEAEFCGDHFANGVEQFFEEALPASVALKGMDAPLEVSSDDDQPKDSATSPEPCVSDGVPPVAPTPSSDDADTPAPPPLPVHTKDIYYKQHFEAGTDPKKLEVQVAYLRGLHWVLHYYHAGVASWGWYYPYHYAPLVVDLGWNLEAIVAHEAEPGGTPLDQFDLGKPFLPLHQLIAVLPPLSGDLLPECYKQLMCDVLSPVHDMYPNTFQLDMENKHNSWEAVVLLPFIDESRLLQAVEVAEQRKPLTEEERQRNTPGSELVYQREPEQPTVLKSLLTTFSDVNPCLSVERIFTLPRTPGARFRLPAGLEPAPAVPRLLRGVSGLHTVLRKVGMTLFGVGHSERETLILKVPDSGEPTAEAAARALLGRKCIFDWPYLWEGVVGCAVDAVCRFEVDQATGQVVKRFHGTQEFRWWTKEINWQYDSLLTTQGIDITSVRVLLEVWPVEGLIVTSAGTRLRWYADRPILVPSQLVIRDASTESLPVPPFFSDVPLSLAERFPVGAPVVYVGDQHARLASVLGVDLSAGTLKLALAPLLEQPDIARAVNSADDGTEAWLPLTAVARRLQVSDNVLYKVTAMVSFEPGRINLGLGFRVPFRNQQAMSYARKGPGGWQLSPKGVHVLEEYRAQFPSVWAAVARNEEARFYDVAALGEEAFAIDAANKVRLACLPVYAKA
eukprot:TRINITY_DN1499_c2_g1_i2.p1 TRINITY_DN1499_c2_g1~~TRINITY_DN1499_c2_g1_i2.p1  ORF type:complete len:1027 (-),score=269.67 TRINITY_DN1499_c2_g1_i2:1040-4084(-)